MWIEIKKDVFEKSDFRTLNFMLQLLMWTPTESADRYNVLIDNETVNKTENYKKLQELDKLLFQKQFEDFGNNTETIKYSITLKKSNRMNELNLEEAVRFFNQPISIIVENSLNDGYFLQAIFEHFGKKIPGSNKRKLIEFIRNDWIQFVNAGGWTNIKNYVKGKLKTYNHLSAAYANKQHKYLRCFVLIDSDKKYLTQDIGTGKEKLKDWLEDKDIKVHILKKRAMENYMPDEVIEAIPSLKPQFKQFQSWVNIYTYLDKEQKDFLNYDKGFSKKKNDGQPIKQRTDLSIEVQNLYIGLSPTQYETLDTGLEFPNFKDYFPSLFEDTQTVHLVHKTSMLEREGGTMDENEFLEILQKINDLL